MFYYTMRFIAKKMTTNHNVLIIINTDVSSQSGKHWQAMFFTTKRNQRCCTFFDSFGRKPFNVFIKKFIRENSDHLEYNHKRLQDYTSLVCGEYCCVFLYYKTQNYTMNKFLNIFKNKKRRLKESEHENNDRITMELFDKIFGKIDRNKQNMIQQQHGRGV